jgi:SAM-dependent methyltransferase
MSDGAHPAILARAWTRRTGQDDTMNPSEFDKFADEYEAVHAANIRLSGESPEYFAAYKVRELHAALGDAAGGIGTILDFGAGVGASVAHFRRHFPGARLVCVDVSARSREIAHGRFGPQLDYRLAEEDRLPVGDAEADLVFASCVFHHIEAATHVALLRELARALRPGGRLAVFEHNPRNPLTVRTVKACAFDENAVLLPTRQLRGALAEAGFVDLHTRYTLFFPHAFRALRGLERALWWNPLGAQYYVMGTRP